MDKRVTGIIAAVCLAVVAQSYVDVQAQGRGGRGAGGGDGEETVPTQAQWDQSAETQRRVATAMKIAATDLAPQFKMFCTPTGPLRLALARQAAGLPPVPNAVIEPTRVFDNMYFIGMTSQNVWAITTSEGIILIDTLNSEAEARDVIVPGLKKAGLDPAMIKYILIGHGHPGQSDHTGGALYLQKTYGAKVVMNPIDADLVLPTQRADRPLAVPDVGAYDGQKITLGDTTVTLAHIPGHTPGTMGMIVPVKWHGTPHTVIVVAASQMPTRYALENFSRVFETYAKPMKVEAVVNMHAQGLQDDFAHLEMLRKNPSASSNPYLYGPERFSRWMDIMIECGRARMAAMGR